MAANTTILSIEQTGMDSSGDIFLLITLLTPAGGSEELTEQLFSRFNTTAEELGVTVVQPILRFGESLEPHLGMHGSLTINCVCTDGCRAERTVVGVSRPGVRDIVLNWPESDLGEVPSLQCPCGDLFNLDGAAISRTASRECGGTFSTGAVWESSMDNQCDLSPTTRRLCEVASVSYSTQRCMHTIDYLCLLDWLVD